MKNVVMAIPVSRLKPPDKSVMIKYKPQSTNPEAMIYQIVFLKKCENLLFTMQVFENRCFLDMLFPDKALIFQLPANH